MQRTQSESDINRIASEEARRRMTVSEGEESNIPFRFPMSQKKQNIPKRRRVLEVQIPSQERPELATPAEEAAQRASVMEERRAMFEDNLIQRALARERARPTGQGLAARFGINL